MNIRKIYLKNFRRFKEQEFDFLEKVTVLIGENGSGKTAILDALSIMAGTYFLSIDGAKSRPIKKDEIRRSLDWEPQLPVDMRVEGSVGGLGIRWKRSLEKFEGALTYKFTRELTELAEKHMAMVRDESGGEEINLPLIAYHGTGRLWAELHRRPDGVAYQKKGSRLDGYYGALEAKSPHRDFVEWFKTYEDEVLKFGEDKSLYNAFVSTITTVVREWDDIKFSWKEDDLLGLFPAEDGKRQMVPFQSLSDGYRVMVALVADLAYRCIRLNPHLGSRAVLDTEGLVMIDEIDMYLHPKWQRHVIEDFKRAFPKLQFIMTTHSPFIVQSLKASEVINLNQGTGENPNTKSIEEIAEEEMDIENVRRSRKFLSMQKAAEEYFDLIEQGERDPSRKEEVKKRLDKLLIEFDNDPVYTAQLKAELKTRLR